MRRRDFVTGIAGSTAAWPLVARAQQPERVRRVGLLLNSTADDPLLLPRVGAFREELTRLGWAEGGNLQLVVRYTANDTATIRRSVAEMVALAPDVILAAGASNLAPLIEATRTVPIVFPLAVDPVAAGYVDSLARPGGNVTGFLSFEYSLSGKWLDLLRQIAPGTKRIAVLRDTTVSAGPGQFGVIQAAATALGIDVSPVNLRDAGEIERAISAFAGVPNGAMIVTASGPAGIHRNLILALAARHRLPATYAFRSFVTLGGLISYGPDLTDQYRRAAGYVDRILRGAKPGDLPVQAPTKYEHVINLKTAKTLGLSVPETLLATASEVIE
ncbi:MAG: ABC transporter substrate-binding protein [Candidatus Odyssella sp.]|nr:ABC transporter substrate-binding protein [Candidatus Odyssella sp.]